MDENFEECHNPSSMPQFLFLAIFICNNRKGSVIIYKLQIYSNLFLTSTQFRAQA